MTGRSFTVGGEWLILCMYDVSREDRGDVLETLLSAGCPYENANEAVSVLGEGNTGYTFTSFERRMTVMVISRCDSPEQMYDTAQHELKHATEHIGEFFGVDCSGEESAYLQGEIARNMALDIFSLYETK